MRARSLVLCLMIAATLGDPGARASDDPGPGPITADPCAQLESLYQKGIDEPEPYTSALLAWEIESRVRTVRMLRSQALGPAATMFDTVVLPSPTAIRRALALAIRAGWSVPAEQVEAAVSKALSSELIGSLPEFRLPVMRVAAVGRSLKEAQEAVLKPGFRAALEKELRSRFEGNAEQWERFSSELHARLDAMAQDPDRWGIGAIRQVDSEMFIHELKVQSYLDNLPSPSAAYELELRNARGSYADTQSVAGKYFGTAAGRATEQDAALFVSKSVAQDTASALQDSNIARIAIADALERGLARLGSGAAAILSVAIWPSNSNTKLDNEGSGFAENLNLLFRAPYASHLSASNVRYECDSALYLALRSERARDKTFDLDGEIIDMRMSIDQFRAKVQDLTVLTTSDEAPLAQGAACD